MESRRGRSLKPSQKLKEMADFEEQLVALKHREKQSKQRCHPVNGDESARGKKTVRDESALPIIPVSVADEGEEGILDVMQLNDEEFMSQMMESDVPLPQIELIEENQHEEERNGFPDPLQYNQYIEQDTNHHHHHHHHHSFDHHYDQHNAGRTGFVIGKISGVRHGSASGMNGDGGHHLGHMDSSHHNNFSNNAHYQQPQHHHQVFPAAAAAAERRRKTPGSSASPKKQRFIIGGAGSGLSGSPTLLMPSGGVSLVGGAPTPKSPGSNRVKTPKIRTSLSGGKSSSSAAAGGFPHTAVPGTPGLFAPAFHAFPFPGTMSPGAMAPGAFAPAPEEETEESILAQFRDQWTWVQNRVSQLSQGPGSAGVDLDRTLMPRRSLNQSVDAQHSAELEVAALRRTIVNASHPLYQSELFRMYSNSRFFSPSMSAMSTGDAAYPHQSHSLLPHHPSGSSNPATEFFTPARSKQKSQARRSLGGAGAGPIALAAADDDLLMSPKLQRPKSGSVRKRSRSRNHSSTREPGSSNESTDNRGGNGHDDGQDDEQMGEDDDDNDDDMSHMDDADNSEPGASGGMKPSRKRTSSSAGGGRRRSTASSRAGDDGISPSKKRRDSNRLTVDVHTPRSHNGSRSAGRTPGSNANNNNNSSAGGPHASGGSRLTSPQLSASFSSPEMKKRSHTGFEIDNVVSPFFGRSTTVETVEVSEILTPKWKPARSSNTGAAAAGTGAGAGAGADDTLGNAPPKNITYPENGTGDAGAESHPPMVSLFPMSPAKQSGSVNAMSVKTESDAADGVVKTETPANAEESSEEEDISDEVYARHHIIYEAVEREQTLRYWLRDQMDKHMDKLKTILPEFELIENEKARLNALVKEKGMGAISSFTRALFSIGVEPPQPKTPGPGRGRGFAAGSGGRGRGRRPGFGRGAAPSGGSNDSRSAAGDAKQPGDSAAAGESGAVEAEAEGEGEGGEAEAEAEGAAGLVSDAMSPGDCERSELAEEPFSADTSASNLRGGGAVDDETSNLQTDPLNISKQSEVSENSRSGTPNVMSPPPGETIMSPKGLFTRPLCPRAESPRLGLNTVTSSPKTVKQLLGGPNMLFGGSNHGEGASAADDASSPAACALAQLPPAAAQPQKEQPSGGAPQAKEHKDQPSGTQSVIENLLFSGVLRSEKSKFASNLARFETLRNTLSLASYQRAIEQRLMMHNDVIVCGGGPDFPPRYLAPSMDAYDLAERNIFDSALQPVPVLPIPDPFVRHCERAAPVGTTPIGVSVVQRDRSGDLDAESRRRKNILVFKFSGTDTNPA